MIGEPFLIPPHVHIAVLQGDPVAAAWVIEQLELEGERLGLKSSHNKGFPT